MLEVQLSGREQELSTLEASFAEACESRPQLVEIRGPAGIGKTALLDEYAARLRRDGVLVVRTSITGPGTLEMYRPVGELVGGVLQSRPEPDKRGLGRWKDRWGKKSLDATAEVLALVPGMSILAAGYKIADIMRGPGDSAEGVSLEKYGSNRVGFFCDVLTASARAQPLVICIDDMQWVDDGTLEVLIALLRKVAEASSGVKLQILWAARGAQLERLESAVQRYFAPNRGCNWRPIDLETLGPDAVQGLAERYFMQPCDLSPTFAAWFQGSTEGNPLRMRGAIAALAAQGLIVERGGGFALAEPFDGNRPPDDLARSMEAFCAGETASSSELSGLPVELRRFLEVGALWGQAFPVAPVAGIAELDVATTWSALRTALRRGLLREVTDLAVGARIEPAVAFTSNAYSQFLARSAPRAVAMSVHESVATWWSAAVEMGEQSLKSWLNRIETDGERLRVAADLLRWSRTCAKHYARAGRHTDAVAVLVSVAETSARSFMLGHNDEQNGKTDRQAQHLLWPFLGHVEEQLFAAEGEVRWPDDAWRIKELKVKLRFTVARVLVEIQWYRRCTEGLDELETLVEEFAEPALTVLWMSYRAQAAFAACEVDRGRDLAGRCLSELREAQLDDRALEQIIDSVEMWLDVAAKRAFLDYLSCLKCGSVIAARVEDIARQDLVFEPWQPEEAEVVDGYLLKPSRAVLSHLAEVASFYLDEVIPDDPGLSADVIDVYGRAIKFFDRLERVADENGWTSLAGEIASSALSYLQDAEEVADEEELEELSKREAGEVQALLEAPPFTTAAHTSRVAVLVERHAHAPASVALYRLVADRTVDRATALRWAERALEGRASQENVVLATALLSREDSDEGDLARVAAWLEPAAQALDPASVEAGVASRLLARVCMENEDFDHAAKHWGSILSNAQLPAELGEDARDGLEQIGGDVEPAERTEPDPPQDDLPYPVESFAVEEEAERCIGIGRGASDPEVHEAWFRRALHLYDRVPDGLSRKDDLLEELAQVWFSAALDEEDSDMFDGSLAHAKVLLAQAREVNVNLGDHSRVFDLDGTQLEWLLQEVMAEMENPRRLLEMTRERLDARLRAGDLGNAEGAVDDLLDAIEELDDSMEEDPDRRSKEIRADLRKLADELWQRLRTAADDRHEPWACRSVAVRMRGLA